MMSLNRSASLQDFKLNIDLLEVMFSPYEDKKYKKELEEMTDRFMKDIAKYRGIAIPKEKFYTLEWIHLKSKYCALMKLAFRKRLLPQYELKEKIV